MTTHDKRRHPLEGLTILDFSRIVAGPYLTMTLADLGAEVIKIEACGQGDEARLLQPFGIGEEAPIFFALNRSKKSVAIDIRTAEGRELCRQLAQQADVLIENFRAGVMERNGLGYEALSALNPKLIYCSITGYGHDSPYRLTGSYDPVAQAEGGLVYLTGRPEHAPVKAPASVMDTFTGIHAGMAILAALYSRRDTGQGQFIDLALYDTTLAVLGYMHQVALAMGENPPRTGNAMLTMAPADSFPCADGDLILVCGNDGQYRRLCIEVLERPDLLEDARFVTNHDRVRNRTALNAQLSEIFEQHPRDYWVGHLRRAGVPGGAVRTPLEALDAPETLARDMVWLVTDPHASTVRTVGSPLRLSGTPVAPPTPPPLLGQHTRDVLRDKLNLSLEEIGRLEKTGVIQLCEEPTTS
jgi:crotonobetainyl-CoA:carnitine CoA-transferase CaiB-like acyl-CoA transferase